MLPFQMVLWFFRPGFRACAPIRQQTRTPHTMQTHPHTAQWQWLYNFSNFFFCSPVRGKKKKGSRVLCSRVWREPIFQIHRVSYREGVENLEITLSTIPF